MGIGISEFVNKDFKNLGFQNLEIGISEFDNWDLKMWKYRDFFLTGISKFGIWDFKIWGMFWDNGLEPHII